MKFLVNIKNSFTTGFPNALKLVLVFVSTVP